MEWFSCQKSKDVFPNMRNYIGDEPFTLKHIECENKGKFTLENYFKIQKKIWHANYYQHYQPANEENWKNEPVIQQDLCFNQCFKFFGIPPTYLYDDLERSTEQFLDELIIDFKTKTPLEFYNGV